MSPSIIITGATGFIGTSLVRHFQAKNWKVLAFVRNIPSNPIKGINYHKFDLNGEIAEKLFEESDYLIHCAYVKYDDNPNSDAINIAGTKQLLELSRRYKFKRNIFLSSMSAQADALSHYGQHKFSLEKYFHTEADAIIRPGLVLGNGGLFKTMSSFIRKNRIVPLIGGGNQPIQTVFIEDLILAIDCILEKNMTGTYLVAECSPVSYRKFYQALCEKLQIPAKFISLPYAFLNIGITLAALVGIKLPITKENLLGLKNLKPFDVSSDLNRLGVQVRDYQESLRMITLD